MALLFAQSEEQARADGKMLNIIEGKSKRREAAFGFAKKTSEQSAKKTIKHKVRVREYRKRRKL